MGRFLWQKGVFMTWTYHIKLDQSYSPQTLRELLQKTWWLSRKVVHFLRTERRVLVNQRYQPVSTVVRTGDLISLTFKESDFSTPLPPFDPDSSQSPDVLFENDDLLVVNKPAGIKTHANQPHELGSMINFLQAYFAKKDSNAYNVHRLDQWTSGALLVAKNPVVVPILSRQISQKLIQRTYLCVVEGHLKSRSGTITLPIGLDPHDQRKRQINGPGAQPATTHYQVVREFVERSLLRVQLATGRTHQIRVHLAALGHPIVGDPLYNSLADGAPMRLHSWQVKFPLPFSQSWQTVTAPVPNYFGISLAEPAFDVGD